MAATVPTSSGAQDPHPDKPGESPDRFRISLGTYRKVVIVALALLFAIVITGAAVRLTGSGLGCSRWPNCEPGEFIEIGSPNQAIEQLNRMFTGAVSVAVIAAVLGAARLRNQKRRDLLWLSAGLVGGVLGQIVLGGITVLLHLHPVAVAGHFLLSMILVCDATVLLWRTGMENVPVVPRTNRDDVRLGWVAMAAGALVLAATGPLVTGSGPHAGDLEAPRFNVAIPDATRIHSLSVWAFCALVIVLLVRLRTRGAPEDVNRRGMLLLAVIVAQGAIGYLQYEQGIPAQLVILHIVGATSVAIAATWFQCGLFTPVSSRSEGSTTNPRNGDPVGSDRTRQVTT